MPFIADDISAKPDVTNVILIIDESGSMSDCHAVTIETINAYFGKLAAERGHAVVTVYKFDYWQGFSLTKIIDEMPANLARISTDNYVPRGGTPLWDAVGSVVSNTPAQRKTLVVIQTDGFENQSEEWTDAKLKALIAEREKAGWTFVFLAADLDKAAAQQSAVAMGMSTSNTMSYSKAATTTMGATLSAATKRYGDSGGMSTREFLAEDEKEIK